MKLGFEMIDEVQIGDVSYDSYASLPYAQLYLAAQIQATTWAASTEEQQSVALVSMTRVLDRQTWQGEPSGPVSGPWHAFPRSGLFYSDGTTPVDPEVIPTEMMDACCEGAAILLAGYPFQDEPDTFNFNRIIKAGSVMIERFRQIGPQPRFPQIIQELIGLWLGGSDTPFGALAHGTRRKSIFNHRYDFNRGF